MHDSAPLYEHDRALLREASSPAFCIAGIDEAGRGPLAGPVVVAAVILPLEDEDSFFSVYDSKAVDAAARRELFEALTHSPRIRYAIAERDSARIDEVNILRATHEAMREVALRLKPDLALVDGLPVPAFPLPARFIVKGDATSASIAAASILAKVHRDALMEEYDKTYPGYGFAQHKGYGTRAHLDALRELGPCPIHRLSFAPVREIVSPQLTFNFD